MIRILIYLSLAALPVLAQKSGDWQLLWSDEFNGSAKSAPDESKWSYELGGGGWGNQELEVYTKSPENIFEDGQGHLVMRAVKTADSGYTSARLRTLGKFSFTYGRAAARIRIPRGQGIWPAFWMMGTDIQSKGWPGAGEIDIMENIGKEPNAVHGTIHGPGYSGAQSIGEKFELPGGGAFADDFHEYAVVWSPGKIVFEVDGKPYHEVTPSKLPKGGKWVFDHPFYLLLNLAVGGAWPGNPDATTKFPQELVVDWVRVWQPKS